MNVGIAKRELLLSAGKVFLLLAALAFGTYNGWSQVGAAQSGWVYVLDSQNLGNTSRILLVDPSQGTVIRSLSVGRAADMALAPDGSLLYVASEYWDAAAVKPDPRLEIFDASGNRVASIPNPDGIGSTSPVYPTRMAMSPTGNWLYITKSHEEGFTELYLSAFNTATRQFLPSKVSMPGCKIPVLLPTPDDLKLSAICHRSGVVRDITFADTTPASKSRGIRVADSRQTRSTQWTVAFLHPGAQKVGLISADGSKMIVDRGLGKADMIVPAGLTKADVGTQRGLLAKDQSAVFFGDQATVNQSYSSRFDEVVAADPVTFSTKMTIPTTARFFNLAMSGDGKTMFTVSPDLSALTVIDMAAGKVVRQLPVGQSPTMVVAIP